MDVLISQIQCLPALPRVFYGRDQELKYFISIISGRGSARIAIRGAASVGKTVLALAVNHNPVISEMFGGHRYFVDCEGASDGEQLVAATAVQLGLKSIELNIVINHLSAIATGETPCPLSSTPLTMYGSHTRTAALWSVSSRCLRAAC